MAPAAAWFIVGDDVAAWVAELARWGVPLADVRLYPVPTGSRDPTPAGVLAVTAARPAVDRALPYAQAGDRLFHPADAALDPPVSAEDLKTALRHDVQVLHPTAGLVGFAKTDAIGVHDLLAPPSRRSADWSIAEPGPSPLPMLVSVEAEPQLMSIGEMLGMGQDDIGSTAGAELEPDPPPGLLGKMKGMFAKPKPPTPASLAAKRERELKRLLELMKSDPDAGLQHALPLRDYATRGVAPPSASLGKRPVDFNLSKLSGGSARGDSWSMDADLRRRLTAEYREAANRELDLGRHRRAAYIFAHLLGDFAAAAGALAKGRHYREAAAVYRDQLKNARAAADCLASGGLLAEAIPLYVELSQFELAGDLHAKLGQPADAAGCYRRATSLYQSRGDPVGAARLLAGKLADPDAALALLAATWPESDKAATCLHEWFAIAGQLNRHADAGDRVGRLRDAAVPWYRAVTLAETLSTVAATYPGNAVRDRAADATRAIAGRRLPAADPAERASLVRAVVALVPADKLLARDGVRFTQPTTRPAPLALKAAPPLVRTFRLPPGFTWRIVVATGNDFLALGTTATSCTLVRGAWHGHVQSAGTARSTEDDGGYALLPPHGDRLAVTLVPTAGRPRPRFGMVSLPADDAFPHGLTFGTGPAYLDAHVVGACRHENGSTWLVRATKDEVTLAAYAADVGQGGPLLTRQLHGVTPAELSPAPVALAARRSDVFVAARRQLLHMGTGFRVRRIDLPGDVRSLVPSPPSTAVRVLVTFDDGWGLVRDGDCRPFGQKLARPAAAWMPDGSVVAVGVGSAHVYRPTDQGPAFVRAFDVPLQAPVAVLPAGVGHLAAVDADGAVYVYRQELR